MPCIADGTCACRMRFESAAKREITVVGSTALQPMVEMAAEEYQKDNHDVSITVQGGGSGTGLSQVQAGAVSIGNSDIFANQQPGIKVKDLVDHKVCVMGLAPVTNKEAGITKLTMEQLRGIFSGKYTNWKQVGGKNLAIVLINRAQGSGTRAAFESAVMGNEKMVKAQEQESNGTVSKMVAHTPGAISYLSFSYISKDVLGIAIDGVKPTAGNVQTGEWKIWSYEHMYTYGKPNEQTKKLLGYMKSDYVQKNLVKALGYVSISEMKVKKIQTAKSCRSKKVNGMDPIRDKILKRSKESNQDIIGKILSYAAIVLILAVVVSIFAFVFAKGIATFTENHASLKDFLTGTDWNPNSKGEDGKPLVGALPMIVGSFAVTLLAAFCNTVCNRDGPLHDGTFVKQRSRVYAKRR